jgi:TIR domain
LISGCIVVIVVFAQQNPADAKMSTLFISYSSAEREFAERMYKKLKTQGYESLFLDYDPLTGIPAGSDWQRELYRQLKRCRAMVVLCSPEWNQSKWCFAEFVYAKAMGKDVFPVKIAVCDLPAIVADAQFIDLQELGEDAGYQRLWRGLEEKHLSPQDALPRPARI